MFVIDLAAMPAGELAAPTRESTGPRIPITGETLNSIGALQAAATGGGVVVGRQINSLILSQPIHGTYRFEDCRFIGPFFPVRAWWGQGTRPTANVRTLFDHCDFVGGEGGAGITGENYILRHCRFSRSGDCVKASGAVEVYGCFMGDLWVTSGDPHGDVVQILSGDDILVHWNTMEAKNAADSPLQPGALAHTCTQFGAPAGDVTNVRIHDNSVDGGQFTLRGGGDWNDGTPYLCDIEFRRNKHGRTFANGPIAETGTFDGGRAVSDYDASNVYADTGLPVSG